MSFAAQRFRSFPVILFGSNSSVHCSGYYPPPRDHPITWSRSHVSSHPRRSLCLLRRIVCDIPFVYFPQFYAGQSSVHYVQIEFGHLTLHKLQNCTSLWVLCTFLRTCLRSTLRSVWQPACINFTYSSVLPIFIQVCRELLCNLLCSLLCNIVEYHLEYHSYSSSYSSMSVSPNFFCDIICDIIYDKQPMVGMDNLLYFSQFIYDRLYDIILLSV